VSSTDSAIPYSELDTIFLDAGNTLMSIDFDWVCRELQPRGVTCSAQVVRRAEAAARPALSAGIASIDVLESQDTFTFYLGLILMELDRSAGTAIGEPRIAELAAELTPVLRGPGKTQQLWSWVLPGVREALTRLTEVGLRLAVVSNSDGSVEAGLVDQGLRDHFFAVVDSQVVGYEKPDPRIFEAALSRIGSAPERTLHVGDLFSADVVGARRAGVHALLLDPFGDWEDVDCHRLPDLQALAGLIGGRSNSR